MTKDDDIITVPLSEACEKLGLNYQTALYRLNRGRDWWRPLGPPPQDTQKE